MLRTHCLKILLLTSIFNAGDFINHRRNYNGRYTNSDLPQWKQRACEKPPKGNSHYICDDKGDVKCLPGWQGDLCQVPICRKGCDPMNGYCQRPGECRCRIGYTGELCDKCIPLPGCKHGYCKTPFECKCKPGWDGLFCTEPTCREGCHSTRGYCEIPGECRCRIGWGGRTCSDCSVLPGCQHGNCTKPLECNCMPGYTGLLCQTPLCSPDCSKKHGYCRKPGECRCKVGWTGPSCDKCFPYPGCENGYCERPWECICKAGWGGMLCDEKLIFCNDNPDICQNGGECVSLTKDDGNYQCNCKQGYLGKNCEIVDEFMLTSTAAPRITPPPMPIRFEDEVVDEPYFQQKPSKEVQTLDSGPNRTSFDPIVSNNRKRIDIKPLVIPLVFPTAVTSSSLAYEKPTLATKIDETTRSSVSLEQGTRKQENTATLVANEEKSSDAGAGQSENNTTPLPLNKVSKVEEPLKSTDTNQLVENSISPVSAENDSDDSEEEYYEEEEEEDD